MTGADTAHDVSRANWTRFPIVQSIKSCQNPNPRKTETENLSASESLSTKWNLPRKHIWCACRSILADCSEPNTIVILLPDREMRRVTKTTQFNPLTLASPSSQFCKSAAINSDPGSVCPPLDGFPSHKRQQDGRCVQSTTQRRVGCTIYFGCIKISRLLDRCCLLLYRSFCTFVTAQRSWQ